MTQEVTPEDALTLTAARTDLLEALVDWPNYSIHLDEYAGRFMLSVDGNLPLTPGRETFFIRERGDSVADSDLAAAYQRAACRVRMYTTERG